MTDIAAVVAAAASSRGIGAGGNLVWRLPADMSHFKHVTMTPPSSSSSKKEVSRKTKNAVIMGRKTWESIPAKFRPLDNRMNVILSRSESHVVDEEDENDDNVMFCTSLKDAMDKLKKKNDEFQNVGDIFVIGGGEVYKEGIESGLVNKVIYTMVDNLSQEQENSFDTWFPELKADEWTCSPFSGQEVGSVAVEDEKKEDANIETSSFHEHAIVHTDAKSGIKYQFLEYSRKPKKTYAKSAAETIEEGAHVNPEEMQYLQMCRDIIENGVERGDRTGTGTLSKFGTQMRFSLRDGTLPLLTTKRTFWRGVAEELLWFVQVGERYQPHHPFHSLLIHSFLWYVVFYRSKY